MENELWVECIDNRLTFTELTVGKKYKVIKLVKLCGWSFYILSNDKGKETHYDIDRFKIPDKTPNLTVIKWNGTESLSKLIYDKDIPIQLSIFINTISRSFVLDKHIRQSTLIDRAYRYSSTTDSLIQFIEEINKIAINFNIKIELEQLKFKINCDKLYSKEEADRLRENGIDISEVRV